MIIPADWLGPAFLVGSILVTVMLIHYLLWAGKRNDVLCTAALIAVVIGLHRSERAASVPGEDQILLALGGIALFVLAVVAWREGLRRRRNAP